MIVVKIILATLLVCLLTLLTQVGGIVFLISLLFYRVINKHFHIGYVRLALKTSAFLALYLLSTFIVVPIIAKPLGRVQLPLTATNHLQPLTVWTYLLNRNYVRPELRDITYNVANAMNGKYPGTIVNYLDSGFPFIDKFPLPPHLSHNDGRKLDIAFLYFDKNGNQTNENPSPIGYGVCEGPRPGEVNRPDFCSRKGFWQYSKLQEIISQDNKALFPFDAERTRALVNFFASEKGIKKILIEPHLKERLKLTSSRIRLHGCNAVRHDDHMHVQL